MATRLRRDVVERSRRGHGLTIERRVTLTLAILTLLVLVPASIVLRLVVVSLTERDEVERATETLRRAAQDVYFQLDDDVPVKFKGDLGPFKTLSPSVRDWAIVRGDGTMVRQVGLLANETWDLLTPHLAELRRALATGEKGSVLVSPVGTDIDASGGLRWRIAWRPVPKFSAFAYEDLPPSVRTTIGDLCPEGVYVRAKNELKRGESAAEVELLIAAGIRELTIRYDGVLLDDDLEILATSLPGDLRQELSARGLGEWSEIERYVPHETGLLAVPRGASDIAVSRYGEVHHLDASGAPQLDTATRPWLLTLSEERASGARSGIQAAIFLGAPFLWVTLVLIGWQVARRSLRPVRQIIEAAAAIEPARLHDRLPVSGRDDELNRIARTINTMLDRIERGYDRERRFTSDASHELRGPLAKMRGEIDLALARDRESASYRASLLDCRRYVETLERVTRSLLLLARLEGDTPPPRRPVDLADIAFEALSTLEASGADRVNVRVDSERPVVVPGDRELVSIAVRNLLENALRYAPGQEVECVVRHDERSDAELAVCDRGPGIPPDELERVLQPFGRVDAARDRASGGTGLGLSIVAAIARALGGSFRLRCREGGGLIAAITWPLH